MDRQIKSLFLLGFLVLVNAQTSLGSIEALCQRSWEERMLWTSENPTQIDSDAFREDILQGKPARVVIQSGSYKETFVLDNVNMNGRLICGEFSDRVTSPLGPNSEYQPILVCTDGNVDFLNTSISKWEGNVVDQVWSVTAISFRTRDYSPENAPVSSRYLDGTSSMKYPDNYLSVAMKSEMRGVMQDRGYVFNMENVHIDQTSGHINAQSLSHVSQRYTIGGGISFKSQPYYWLSSWETSGRRDSARWTMGDIKSVGHTNDYVALQWFADACWTTIYKHDKNGKRLTGSLEMLKAHIRMGHRVRVHFDGFTLEANSVVLSPGGTVMAQTSSEMARRLGPGTDKTFFNTKTRQVYRLIHTTGEVRSFYFFIEDGELSQTTADRFGVTWSVDTRPWNTVLSTNARNQVTFGSIRDLVQNMEAASSRIQIQMKETGGMFRGQTNEIFMEVNNMRSPNPDALIPDIISQSLRTVPFYLTRDGKTYTMNVYRPEKQYIEVSTIAGLAVNRFNMKSKRYMGRAGWDVQSISWFQDASISG